ncbi:histidine kinase [Agromyces sp. GXS1127]|uniref:histidine kinase n=1 Tax=Agromyces sp. GXS1127 TaxID=3424181 RepID=UPI003D314100
MATGRDEAAPSAAGRIAIRLVATCAAASGIVVLVSVPSAWRVRTDVCATACPPGSIDAAAAARLDALGLGVPGYVAMGLVLMLVLVGTCLAVTALLLRGALTGPSTARGAVTAAAALVAIAVGFPQLVPALVTEYPGLGWLAPVVDASVLLLVWWLAAFPDGVVRGWLAHALVATAVGWVALSAATVETEIGAAVVAAGTLVVAALGIAIVTVGLVRRDRSDRRLVAGTYATIGGALVVLAVAGVVQAAGFAPIGTLADLAVQVLLVAAFLAIPVAVASAVLRRGLWGTAASVARIIAAGAVALAAVSGFAMAAASLHLAGAEPAIALTVPAALLAVAVPPLDRLAVRGARRILTGSSADRRSALRDLDARLALAATPESGLDGIGEELARALGVPGATILVGVPDADRSGDPRDPGTPTGRELPLVHSGRTEGVLAIRPGRTALDPAQLVELEPVRAHLAAVLHARRLARELDASRRALVAAREDERRRVRDDLHDELGPTLAAAALTLGAAEREANRHPPEAVRLLADARSQLALAVDDVRRIVRGLRPPALDDVGLTEAVRAYASAVDGPVRVEVSGRAPDPVPASVESAAYAIALEAIANAIRHSGGSRCSVAFDHDDGHLVLEVSDDGSGMAASRRGIGSESMERRARELGGRLQIDADAGGTTVRAVLPIVERMPREAP